MSRSSLRLAQILCPTDFSVFSARAFRHALVLARQFGARVKVLHVLPLLPNVGGSPLVPVPMFPLPEHRQHVENELKRFVEGAHGSGVSVTTEIRDGLPWREILAVAEESQADLVALGTHGRSGFERFLLGSVTEKLLGHLPCPTLTVCHEEGRTWDAPGLVKRILCATDFSSPANEALTLALSFADAAGSELTLLHVIDALPEPGEPAYAVPEIAGLRQALEEQARPKLLALPATLSSGHEVEKRLATGRAAERILELATEQRADLIVLGTVGHRPLSRMLFGSTSDRVVREATCPVITVPPLGARTLRGRDLVTAMAEVQGARE